MAGWPHVFGTLPSGNQPAQDFDDNFNVSVLVVASMAALRAVTPAGPLNVAISGFATIGDGGEGLFVWNSSDTRNDDGGTIIIPNSGGTGRWNRIIKGWSYLPEWFGAKGDGATDDTAAINSAITALNSAATSVVNVTTHQGGCVQFGPKVYKVTNIVRKSGVDLRGAGQYATRILPAGTSGYTLGVSGTSNGNVMSFSGVYSLCIAPVDNYAGLFVSRPTVGGIDQTYVQQCPIEDVLIHNIQGIGINRVQDNDSYLSNCSIYWTGTATVPACLYNYGTADLTNAIHAIGLHIESCQFMLEISDGGATTTQERENHFVGCKFEWGGVTVTGPGIKIESSLNTEFVSCEFSMGPTTTQNFINVNDSGGSGNVQGLRFVACGFVGAAAMTGNIINSGGTRVLDIGISACHFLNCVNTLNGPDFIVTGTEFYGCCAGGINLTTSTFSDNVLAACDYAAANTNPTNMVRTTGLCLVNGNNFVSATAALIAQSPIAIVFASGAAAQAAENAISSNFSTGYFFATTGNRVSGVTGNSATAHYSGAAGWQQANWYDDQGTFTATGTGFTVAPTATAAWQRNGKKVLVDYPSIANTSNSTNFTITGLPADIVPTSAKQQPAVVVDNGVAQAAPGEVQLSAGGNVITVSKTCSGGGGFTAGGTKATGEVSWAYTVN